MMMNVEAYLSDPCRASSLPFWKAERFSVPPQISVIRDDEFFKNEFYTTDEPYFKMIHRMQNIKKPRLTDGFKTTSCDAFTFASHINSCYVEEGISPEELIAYRLHPVYKSELYIAVEDCETRNIVATGIAELDDRIGEGVLEWIQVSKGYRRNGLGAFIVLELLNRMQTRATFVTVSGRMNSASSPIELYRACGFTDPVIWHVVIHR